MKNFSKSIFKKYCENFTALGDSPLSTPEGGPTLASARVGSHSELDKVRNNENSFLFP
jgi:hypothetical protein